MTTPLGRAADVKRPTLRGSARGLLHNFLQVMVPGFPRTLRTRRNSPSAVDPKPGHSVFESRSGAGDEARTRDPYLGKVQVQFCIRDGLKAACKRVLTPAFHGPQR
jgi:hypothetical protein